FLGVDVDAVGLQLPGALGWRTGRIGRAQQQALLALQLDLLRAAIAAAADQLVAQVLDRVAVGGLVAMGALGEDPHARILVADAALGGVGAGFAVIGELVGAQELVAAGEF